jgi:two-component system nitrate/nitrite sensor histidine kinase NarX
MDDPLVVDDLAEDARLSRPACLDERVGSLVSVPLRSRDRTLGLLTLYAREPRAFQAIDRTLLSAIGWELGVAVENARWFAAMRESAVAEERAVIAAELHDGIAQSLAYLNVQTARVEQLLQGGETEGARRELDGIREVIRSTYEDVRQLLVDFRSAPKEGSAFASSLHAHLATFELRNQIRAELVGEECLQDLAFDPQAEVFRMVQEALANVRKHAQASRVRVVCARMPAAWEIRVEDDGVGCDATRLNDPSGAHLGLRIMRERAARVGGSVRLSSTPGRGTTVMIEVPVGSDEDRSAR